jgi:hypothetical protein
MNEKPAQSTCTVKREKQGKRGIKVYRLDTWGYSSAGRALEWHSYLGL